jgi:hypothetical protein
VAVVLVASTVSGVTSDHTIGVISSDDQCLDEEGVRDLGDTVRGAAPGTVRAPLAVGDAEITSLVWVTIHPLRRDTRRYLQREERNLPPPPGDGPHKRNRMESCYAR